MPRPHQERRGKIISGLSIPAPDPSGINCIRPIYSTKFTYAVEPSSLPYSQPFCASGISTVMTSPGSNCSRVRLAPDAWGTIACTLAVPLLLLPSLLPLASPKEPEREVRPVGSKPVGRHARIRLESGISCKAHAALKGRVLPQSSNYSRGRSRWPFSAGRRHGQAMVKHSSCRRKSTQN